MPTSPLLTDAFFTYTCDACAAPVCERQSLMNLALGEEDTLLCLSCLAQQESITPSDLATTSKRYILSRACFKKPWFAFAAQECPLLAIGNCPCQ